MVDGSKIVFENFRLIRNILFKIIIYDVILYIYALIELLLISPHRLHDIAFEYIHVYFSDISRDLLNAALISIQVHIWSKLYSL
ncbi:hypothetical protein AQUCO_02100017v1 [Aquilegia coerulea]|uniref:Uncharacterized protein n=1 Tax=Aquilegia coerulea TaxID=218851 RepID=A0A2G5DEF6_AQUCA|nr:hypothetical protein AQUCO_02100017v1 [Aquilegia coerulea]